MYKNDPRNLDFDVFDISPCFSDTDKMHFMVWEPREGNMSSS